MLLDDVILEISHFPFDKSRVVHFLENEEPKDVQDEQEGTENCAKHHISLQIGLHLALVLVVFLSEHQVDDNGKAHQAHSEPDDLGK